MVHNNTVIVGVSPHRKIAVHRQHDLQFRTHKTLDAAFEAGRSVAMAHGVIQQHHALPSVKLVGGHLDQLIGPHGTLTPTETWQNW
jgi:hypothetical protein